MAMTVTATRAAARSSTPPRSNGAPGLLLLVGAFLLNGTAAHSCGDAAGVRCTAVISASNAAHRDGTGYEARGQPMCTPGGEKLYCLMHHSYHRCGAGEAPCCLDGSRPSHHGPASHGHGHDDGLTCAGAAGGAVAAAESEASKELEEAHVAVPAPIVLDDMDDRRRVDMANAFEGSYAPCLRDAYANQFHHDWARNKGRAHLTLKFDPPRSGCYKLEEHHPGGEWACSRYLPENAQLEVDYCKGRSATFSINQAKRAAQWNEVASLMFYEGHEGRLTMRSSEHERCAEGQCFWVVDAFRLTWTGERCDDAAASGATAAGTVAKASMREGEDDKVKKDKEMAGTLLLQARFSDGEVGGDLQAQLEAQRGPLSEALAMHLGYVSVRVTSVVAQVRRLGERRLSPAAAAREGLFALHFVARGGGAPAEAAMTSSGLKQALQRALEATGTPIEVQSAEVQWVEPPTGPSTGNGDGGDGSDCTLMLLAAGCCVLVLLLAGVGALVVRRRAVRSQRLLLQHEAKQQEQQCKSDIESGEAAVVVGKEVVPAEGADDEKKKRGESEDEIASVSTGTPLSNTGDVAEFGPLPTNSDDGGAATAEGESASEGERKDEAASQAPLAASATVVVAA